MGDKENSKRFNDFAIAFIKEAKEDLGSAKDLFNKNRFSRVVFFSQQCIEKSVKSLLELEKIFVAEHDISPFFIKFIHNNKNYKEYSNELDVVLENINYFEGEWGKTRYPKLEKGKVLIPIETYKKEDAESSLEKAEEVYEIVKKILNKKVKNE